MTPKVTELPLSGLSLPPAEVEALKLWRGFFSPVSERETLFTLDADLHTADLPSWEPCVTINPRWAADDDK
jgi:hypothetical protein